LIKIGEVEDLVECLRLFPDFDVGFALRISFPGDLKRLSWLSISIFSFAIEIHKKIRVLVSDCPSYFLGISDLLEFELKFTINDYKSFE
jgi:hypothetical protein